MAGMLRVPRSRGALTGVLLVLLGAWGGVIPFAGPYFGYAYTPGTAWTYTAGRLWLEILPGAAAVLGGLILLVAVVRPVAMAGAVLSALAGAWFTIGTLASRLWAAGPAGSAGVPAGGPVMRILEQIGFFTGLGVVIVFVAGIAVGRLSLIAARDVALPAEAGPAIAATQPAVPAPRQHA
jgi:hypothetical protein